MTKYIVIMAFTVATLFAQTASEFQKKQMQDFKNEKTKFGDYKKSIEEEYDSYKKAQLKAFNDYKKEIGAYWEEPKLSTKKEWVAYTEDKKTRTDVDFSDQTIVVETIAKSEQEAKQKLQLALAKVVTIDTKTAQDSDPLEKILDSIKKPKDIVDGKVNSEPILSTVIFTKPPTKKSVLDYVNQNINKIKVRKSDKIKYAQVYSIKVKMPKDAMLKRSKVYSQEVKKQATKQELPASLVFAIMHSESNFNPRARSHIPAYGLMQLVPKTAGIDSYNYLYNKKKLVSSRYLYDSTNNIIIGSAYLYILYYNYLSKIKNPDSRLYCTIAAYNKAVILIKKLSPKQVYNKLVRDLKHDEARNYLKNVSKRMSAYNKIYG